MNQPKPNQEAAFEALSRLSLGLRSDLDISRQIIGDRVQYVVCDPLTSTCCALSLQDYQIFLHLEPNRTVQQCYQKIIDAGLMASDQKSDFYSFLLDLNRRNLIRLPIVDGNQLYQEYSGRREKEAASLPMRLLSYQLPLWNPDRFLEVTQRSVSPLFTRWFAAAWLALVAMALYVVSTHWKEFTDSTSSMLALQSLPIVIVLLCSLKFVHELGHGYACKQFGGYVPEMGIIFILGTPCAYVDTSFAWGFRERWQRVVVNLGGMYFESLVAIAAVFAWSLSPPGLLHSIAHYTIVLSTITTVLFNANPLMKFDGYYVISDSLGSPNLRRDASISFYHNLKRNLLGVDAPRVGTSAIRDFALTLFGGMTELYRLVILLSITTFLILQIPSVGLWLGLFYLLVNIIPGIDRLLRYLYVSPDLKFFRPRVLVVTGACLILGTSILFVPITSSISITGVVGREKETYIRAIEPGFVSQVGFKPSQQIDAGEMLFQLTNEELQGRVSEAKAEVSKLKTKWLNSLRSASDESGPLRQQLRQAELDLAAVERAVERLTIYAPEEGVLTEWSSQHSRGRFFQSGEPLVKLESGDWTVRALATDEEVLDSELAMGDRVELVVIGQPGKSLTGHVIGVSPAGQDRIEDSALTQSGGGDIITDPLTRRANTAYFLLSVKVDPPYDTEMRSGIRIEVFAPNRKRSLGRSLSRKIWQFYYRYLVG
jgi:putative peptide zinc metalloprotease protein